MTRTDESVGIVQALAFTGLRLFGQALEVVGWIVLAHRLQLGAFGELSIAFLIARYLGLVADWGASLRGPRDVAGKSDDEIVALIQIREGVTTLLMVAYIAACLLANRAYLAPVALSILGRGATRDWLALGQSRPFRASFPAVLQGTTFALLVAFTHSKIAGAQAIGTAYVASTLCSVWLNRSPLRRTTRFAKPDGWMLLLTIASQMLTSLDTLQLGWLRGARDAGIYAGIYRLSTAVTTAVGLTVVAFIGDATRALERGVSGVAVIRLARHISAGILGIGVLAAPLAYWLIPTVFGPRFESGRGVAVLIVMGAGIVSATHPLLVIHIAKHNDRNAATHMLVAAFGVAVVNMVAIPSLGMTGAAITSVLGQLYVLAYFWLKLPNQSLLIN